MRVISLEMESVQGRNLTTGGHGEHELVEVHGVGPLDAVVADVALLIGNIMEDEGSHGWERVFNDKDQWLTGEEFMRAHKSRSLRMGVDAERERRPRSRSSSHGDGVKVGWSWSWKWKFPGSCAKVDHGRAHGGR